MYPIEHRTDLEHTKEKKYIIIKKSKRSIEFLKNYSAYI